MKHKYVVITYTHTPKKKRLNWEVIFKIRSLKTRLFRQQINVNQKLPVKLKERIEFRKKNFKKLNFILKKSFIEKNIDDKFFV